MFFGTYYHQLDDKGRLRLPAKLREELGSTFYCMQGLDNNIYVMSVDKFEEMLNKFKSVSFQNVEAQRAWSEFTSNVQDVSTDSQGRFILPQFLKDYGGIEKNVVVKGVVDRIEIWSEKNHNSRKTDANANNLIKDLGI